MTNYPVDLHLHSTASDGRLSPTELVALAGQKKMQVIALTDHDTTDGLDEALTAAERHQITVVPGIEFSIRHEAQKGFIGIHLLGYFIDHHQPALAAAVKKVQAGRLEQKIKQIEILQSFGFDIPVEAVLARVAGVPGRPHIAAVLLERHPARFGSIQQVFDEYLGVNKKAHVGRSFALTMAEAAALISQAGGWSVLAHPGVYKTGVRLKTLLENAVVAGVKGVEVFYPYSDPRQVKAVEVIADLLKLPKTGGTDFHGRPQETIQPGDVGITMAEFETIRKIVAQEL